MCKENLIHLCLIIDESGSMYGSENDVVGGFNKMVDEQKGIENGECLVSYFKFADNVEEVFLGKNVKDVKKLKTGRDLTSHLSNTVLSTSTASYSSNGLYHTETITYGDIDDRYVYSPGGCTAMNDGIGTAIDRIGKWLSDMPENERPSKNLIVIMTDGEENFSKEYTLERVKDMIKHQEEKYNWTFVYMGMDIRTAKTADNLGINNRSFSSKSSTDMLNNYTTVSSSISVYRTSDASIADSVMCANLTDSLNETTQLYETANGIKIR